MILVVDDDDAYLVLLPFLFKKWNSPVGLQFVFDGEQAIDYLTGKGKYTDRTQFPLPKMILLDIKMPKVDGFDFLEWKRNQPVFNHLPVVMWSSSDLPRDKTRAAELGALDYIAKPVVGHDLLVALERIYERLTEARASALRMSPPN
jgi:CheY-like chemotaxis protein